jgi:aldose 1-epimerase
MILPQSEIFGALPDGTLVDVFTLTNCHGLRMRVMTYGAVILSLEVPDCCCSPVETR